jgi:linoleoyl-CoA desaturase
MNPVYHVREVRNSSARDVRFASLIWLAAVAVWAVAIVGVSGISKLIFVPVASVVLTTLFANAGHPAGHAAYGDGLAARLLTWSPSMVGISASWWKLKHVDGHHRYLNSVRDPDIRFGPILRLTLGEPRRFFHRYQYLYCWLLYPLTILGMVFAGDVRLIATGRGKAGQEAGIRLRGKFLAEKLVVWLPLMFAAISRHGIGATLMVFSLVLIGAGAILGTTFQLNHCMLLTSETLPLTRPPTQVDRPFSGAVSFCAHRPLLTALLGGLNLHVEHHRDPRAPLSRLRRDHLRFVGSERYRYVPSLRSALASHVRYMRAMGRQG